MNKIGRPDKTGNDARQLLIDAARKKFVSKAYDKVSIRELAQTADVNSAMIKYYFHNKEGLYKAMILEVTGQVMNNFKTHLDSSNLNNLEDFFRSFVEVIKQSPEFPLLMLKEVILSQGVCRSYFINEMGMHHLKIFDQVYARFKKAGKLKDDIDPLFFRMSLMGLTLFPWYTRELMGQMEGVTYDEEFLEKMIKHNTNLMQSGFFKNDTEERNLGENNDQ
jgi:AcrR family transcriptional regulator